MRSEQATRRSGPNEERPAKEARRDQGRDGGKGADCRRLRNKGGKQRMQERKQESGEARRGKNGGQGEKRGEQGGGARARR